MDLRELDIEIRIHLQDCVKSDREGRPEHMRDCMVTIQTLITDFLGECDEVTEEPVVEEEKPTRAGHCQPDHDHVEKTQTEETKQETSEGSQTN